MRREVLLSPGLTEIAPGIKVHIQTQDPFKDVLVSKTARHEALHATAAALSGVGIVDATIRPGEGYLGRVRLDRFDALSFMAPHAFGCDGTGHDTAVVAWMGHDTGSAGAAARSLISGNEHKVQAVAATLETSGTITGYDVLSAIDRVDNPDVQVTIMGQNGEERSFVTRIRRVDGTVPFVVSDSLINGRN